VNHQKAGRKSTRLSAARSPTRPGAAGGAHPVASPARKPGGEDRQHSG
jgi:hypothetical protein